MAGYQNILETYSSLAVKSGQMLDAAKSSDWERLIELEQDCRKMAETLKRVEAGAPRLDADHLRRKVELIQKVLADDAAIRSYAEPRMAQLQALIGSTLQEQRLQHAYDGGAAGA